MTHTRRRILRTASSTPVDATIARRTERRRLQLNIDREALRRWLSKLKRAFHSVERIQARIARLERQIG